MEVTVTCATPSAEIRYTLNGEEPTLFDPVVTSGGSITISRNSILKARAWSGATAGPVTTEDYRITGAISCGYQHGLALSVAGRIWAWGEQASGRLGNGLTSGADIVSPARVQLGGAYFDNGSLIAAGYDHSLVIDQDGNVWSFGENGDGQLGNNSTTDSALPVRVLKSTTTGDYLGASISADAGQSWSVALLPSGAPVAWGVQSSGRLGNGSNSSSSRNYAGSVLRGDDPGFPALSGIRQVAAGHGHGLAREPNASEQTGATGRVWVWGSNTSGQLGLGSTTHGVRAVPMLLNSTTELTDALDISGGGAHTAVLRWKDGDSDLAGTVWCCGNQSNGRLGNGSTSSADIKYPVRVIKVDSNPLTGIRQVSAGPTHTLAVDADGHVWAWGNNQYGQLGDGTTTHSGHAKQVKDAAGTGVLEKIVMVSAGGESTNGRSMALAEDGTIWVWGRNDEGQLGNGGTASAISLPVDQGSEIIDEGIPALALQCELVNPEELGSACITVTPSHTGPNGMADIDRVELFIDGCLCATLTGPNWTFDAKDLPAGPRVIYGMVHDVNGVCAKSASATVGVVPEGTVIVSPSNGHSRTQPDGSLEYWLNHGETTMELQLEVPGNPTGTLTLEITDANGNPVSATVTPQGGGQHDISIPLSGHTAPLVMATYVNGQFSWVGEWYPRALTWQASQPVAAQNSGGAVTLPGTPFRNRETATLRASEGGNYHVRAQFDIETFGAPSIEGGYGMVLRGLPDQLAQSTAAGITSADFSFHIPSFALDGGRIRLDLVRLSDGAVTSSTEISPGPAGSGGGLDQGSLQWERQTTQTALVAVAPTGCSTCGGDSASETSSYMSNEGDACSTGYTNPDSTSDYGVDNSFDMGNTGGGAGGANADFQHNDLEDPSVASPASMTLSATEGAVVTADSTGSYAQTVVTATGTTTVADVTSSGYTLVFTGTGQTSPTTKLRIERNVLSANSWSLRFIEQRYLGTVVETRYEQTKVADGSQIWKTLQGAELTALSDAAAPESSFLRRTTVNRGVEQIVSVTPLRGTQVVRVPQRIETVTKAEMTADTGVWETVTSTRNTYRIFPWGDPIVEQVLDPGGRALTKRWDYYTQPGDYLNDGDPGGPTGSRPGLVSGTLDYDGYWQHFEWDSAGRLAKVRSPFHNSPQSTADNACDVWSFTYDVEQRRDVHRIQGVVVGEMLVVGPRTTRSEYRLALSGGGSGSAGTLTTTITRGPVASLSGNAYFHFQPNSDRITSITRPDGTKHTCAWSYSGATLLQNCTEGNAAGTRGTRTVTTRDRMGNDLITATSALDFGGTASNEQLLSTVTSSNLDPLGRPLLITTTFGDGSPAQAHTKFFNCCGLRRETDYRGVVTNNHHDHLKRLETSTSLGVTHGTRYNGLQQQQVRIPESALTPDAFGRIKIRNLTLPAGTIVRSETEANTAGETVAQREASPQHTDGVTLQTTSVTYTYSLVTGTQMTSNFPDGGQRIDVMSLDRRLSSTSGSAVNESSHAYGTPASMTLGSGVVYADKVFRGDDSATGAEWVMKGYDILGRAIETRYPDGAVATRSYITATGQLKSEVDPDGATKLYGYNDEGQLVFKAKDLNGNGVLDLDIDRVSFSETNAASAPSGSKRTWETVSRIYRAGDSGAGGGLVAERSYRSIDGLKSWNVPFGIAGRTSTTTVDLYGSGDWMTITVDANNRKTTTFHFDGLLYSTSVQGGTGAETLSSKYYVRDAHNRISSIYDSRTATTALTFTNNDQTATSTRQITPTYLVTAYGYDSMGRTLTVNSPDSTSSTGATLANVVTRTYDPRGNVLTVSGEQTYDTIHTYDSLSRIETLTTRYGNANGGAGTAQVTSWIYHAQRGWLVEKKYPGESDYVPGETDDYQYTPGGRLRTRTWERGGTTTWHYDFHGDDTGFGTLAKAGDLAAVTYGDSTPAVGYSYNRWGAVDEIDDITGTREFTYRTAIDLQVESEQISVSGVPSGGISIPRKIFHTYDSLGRETRYHVGVPDGSYVDHAVQYGFASPTGRLRTIIHGDSTLSIAEKAFTRDYLANSNLPASMSGPLHTAYYTWEGQRDELKSITSWAGTNVFTVEYGNSYSAVNSIGQRTDANYSGSIYASLSYPSGSAGGAHTFGYNANGELVSQTGGKSHGYQYDPIGNRLSASVNGSTVATYQPNDLNQYDWIDPGSGAVARTHDEDGNLETDGTRIFQWDAENRLISVRRASDDQQIASYAYDYMGRRIHKQTTAIAPQGASQTAYLYDQWNLVCEYSISGSLPPSIYRTYTWGPDLSGTLHGAGGVGGLLVIDYKGNSSLQHAYPLYDGNGNVVATLSNSGGSSTAVANAQHYDPFGNIPVFQGSVLPGFENPFLFSTKHYDLETGLYYYGYRYYDPLTGRWPSRDPIEEAGGVNLYAFLGNDSLAKVDYYGMAPFFLPAASIVKCRLTIRVLKCEHDLAGLPILGEFCQCDGDSGIEVDGVGEASAADFPGQVANISFEDLTQAATLKAHQMALDKAEKGCGEDCHPVVEPVAEPQCVIANEI